MCLIVSNEPVEGICLRASEDSLRTGRQAGSGMGCPPRLNSTSCFAGRLLAGGFGVVAESAPLGGPHSSRHYARGG